ncbi:hypothetical protein ACOMHN_040994 [Nucella lapillus]
MSFLSVARAVLVRLLFAVHGLISIWLLATVTREDRYWYMASGLGLLLLEMTVTLGKKGGKEWKWFCPSVFIYMMCVVPAIWFLELHEMDKRIERWRSSNMTLTAYSLLRSHDFHNETREELKAVLGTVMGFNLELRIPLRLKSEEWIKATEQVLLLLLILGRWLMPKGKLTHDQLSQLLLVYIGTAADIVEFFDAFKEHVVKYEPLLCMAVLGMWSLSLIQFSLVLTAARARRDQTGLVPGRRPRRPVETKGSGCCSPDVYGIVISILLQDAPFLVLRMLLIFKYNVLSYTNMFFTSKNTIVIVLLVYRLVVVQLEKRRKGDDDADVEGGGRKGGRGGAWCSRRPSPPAAAAARAAWCPAAARTATASTSSPRAPPRPAGRTAAWGAA